jgi:hypothetical protein
MIAKEFNVQAGSEEKIGEDFIDDENLPLLEPDVSYGFKVEQAQAPANFKH